MKYWVLQEKSIVFQKILLFKKKLKIFDSLNLRLIRLLSPTPFPSTNFLPPKKRVSESHTFVPRTFFFVQKNHQQQRSRIKSQLCWQIDDRIAGTRLSASKPSLHLTGVSLIHPRKRKHGKEGEGGKRSVTWRESNRNGCHQFGVIFPLTPAARVLRGNGWERESVE